MNLGRRQREAEQQTRNVRPRTDVVENGYAFNVSIQLRRDGNPMYVKVVPLWRPRDTFEPIQFISAITRTLKSEVLRVTRYCLLIDLDMRILV